MDKKLYRSRKDSVIGGVAGGLAEYFSIDPTIVRIIFVVSLFIGGAGVLAYIIMWIVVPEEPIELAYQNTTAPPASENTGEEKTGSDKIYEEYQATVEERRKKRVSVAGIILIILGGIILLDNLMPRIDFGDYFFPLIFIVIGIALLMSAKTKNQF